jgi:5-oxopent-3-ene-1,2,5-tricarboxylate decarboxylase/2-hydroxyhepta-2,4-diene-1,7-dioate isomerase
VDERDVAIAHRTPPHATLFALGLNYADHASELDFKPPTEPLVFIKAPNTFNGDNQTSVRPNNVEYMHYEAELVVVIGKTARKVSEAEAMDYVAGYTVCNDYAIRDYLENYYRPNLRVKSRDGLTPISPTSCQRGHSRPAQPRPAHLRQRRAAPGRHHGGSDLQHPVPDCVPERFYDPAAGRHDCHRHAEGLSDVVPGDEVVVEVEGVGRLVNRIVSEETAK